jgi:hypothetical protein
MAPERIIDGLPFDIGAVLRLYGAGGEYEISDSSRGAADRRFAILAGAKDFVIKAAGNSFTTPERAAGWAALAERYNALGIYAPRFLRNIHGEFGAHVGGFCVYAEEFARYAPDAGQSYEAPPPRRVCAGWGASPRIRLRRLCRGRALTRCTINFAPTTNAPKFTKTA